ncbi:hypothetical protein BO94DRAFT_556022 [Aspergillus sclerotioniger CBS 115572]|uniref:Zn(2)-C6 fungal-type domain-containing protein n=1 Tax=Aspergillus sclerotioniger CBS 115572 TaxID=1450535 RepID=A0A317WW90_9EURO|nr:hypothetical protein BO94DRAFT_556022 [Aspergillus sclerotioniger CBS 115572]PWY88570.1 hypothetical protein BO94DRAFT_556022 [Aspergillus sclerotioniger CBS 115572]
MQVREIWLCAVDKQTDVSRKRRVKCDETRPNCERCSSTGRKCDGYGSSPRSFDRAHPQLPLLSLTRLNHAATEREVRSLQFFYEKTVPSLAGYCGSEFWGRLVMQVSQHEIPVWHALVALGALHENFEKMPGFGLVRAGYDTFALQEYLKAIRALLGPADSLLPASSNYAAPPGGLTVDVCLISCILFVCFEILSSHYIAALSHIQSGMNILGEVSYDPSTGSYHHPVLRPSTVSALEMGNLRRIFIRLRSQTRTGMDQPLMDAVPSEGIFPLEVPECFSSLAEARDLFEYYSYVFRHEYGKMGGMEATSPELGAAFIQTCISLFQKWSGALDQFEKIRGPSLTTKEHIGLKILQMHRCRQAVAFQYHMSGTTDLSGWDMYNPMFQEIVSLAASVVELSGEDGPPSTPQPNPSSQGRYKPSFTLDMGIIDPLYDVATLCRDPLIRRKAVDVLRSATRQEGIFNSYVCAVAAERVISLEEGVALDTSMESHGGFSASPILGHRPRYISRCSEVPDNARLLYAYPKLDVVHGRGFLKVERGEGMEMDIPLPAMAAMLDAEN